MFVYQRITNGILEKPLRFFHSRCLNPHRKKNRCWPSVDWLGKSCLIMVGFINVHKIYRWNQSLCWFNSSICVRQIPFYRHMLISIPILWWIHTWIHHIVCVGAQLQCDVMWPPWIMLHARKHGISHTKRVSPQIQISFLFLSCLVGVQVSNRDVWNHPTNKAAQNWNLFSFNLFQVPGAEGACHDTKHDHVRAQQNMVKWKTRGGKPIGCLYRVYLYNFNQFYTCIRSVYNCPCLDMFI